MGELLTIGHGRLNRAGLAEQLLTAGVESLIDIRRFPHSRTNPDVSQDALAAWLPEEGIDYRWDERLGGRRALRADEDKVDTWWQVKAFRAYAAHTRTTEFADAFAELRDGASNSRTVVMCSESVWWRCHRRIVADVAFLAHDLAVLHLMPEGRSSAHRPSQGARLTEASHLVWDVDADHS